MTGCYAQDLAHHVDIVMDAKSIVVKVEAVIPIRKG